MSASGVPSETVTGQIGSVTIYLAKRPFEFLDVENSDR
jgi:hypothetical protein